MREKENDNIIPWFCLSFAVAILSCVLPVAIFLLWRDIKGFGPVMSGGLVSLVLSGLWFLILIGALAVHRWRGLWLLVGAPFALALPIIVVGGIVQHEAQCRNGAEPGLSAGCFP